MADGSTPDQSTPAPETPGPAEQPGVIDFEALPPAAIHHRLGIEILEASSQRVVGTMPVEGNTQPFGLLHGGASCVLAESLGSIGAALHGLPERVSVGTDINATHHRAASSGIVTGVATPLHLGRTVASYEVVIRDGEGRRLCTARITCLLIPAKH